VKVLLINTAALNTGDAAILRATLEILGEALGPRMDVVVFDQQAETARHYYPDIDFRPELFGQLARGKGLGVKLRTLMLLGAAALWRTPLKALVKPLLPRAQARGLDEFAGADLVVSAGGTYLVPHYRFFPKLLDLVVAAVMRRPFVLFTQSLGPFPENKRWLVRQILRQARLILVRDERSRAHLSDLGISPNRIAQCADAAFALTPRHPAIAPTGKRPLRVAISVRDWPHLKGDVSAGTERYLGAVAAMVRRLIEREEAEITFLSTCQGISEYWTDDSKTADAVVERLPAPLRRWVTIDRDFHTPESLMEVLAGYDVVVATRMHMAILALCSGVPVLPIAYEFKTTELFRLLGLGHLIQDMETVTGDSLCAALEQFLVVRKNLTAVLPEWVGQLRSSARSAGKGIRDAVGVLP
jgi:colanic acid/amylovoran biosynthesis protein